MPYIDRETYTVDRDTVTVAFDEDLTDDQIRAAIDEIADRVEAECERRGYDAKVVREYRTTGGARSGTDVDPTVYDAVLIDGVDDLRAAVLECGPKS